MMDKLNKLVDECNNTYCHSIGKKSINAYYYALAEEIETNLKASKFKVGDRVRIINYKNIFSEGYTKHFWKEIFVINFVMKTNPCTYKFKDLNGEVMLGSFYEK